MTEKVEEQVLRSVEEMHARGGVLGELEVKYKRNRIQDESMVYEHQKHSGELPIVGVNTYVDEGSAVMSADDFDVDVTRSDEAERQLVIGRNKEFKQAHAAEAEAGLARLKQVAREGGNLFEVMMEIVEHCTVGQVTQALFDTGGKFRRNM